MAGDPNQMSPIIIDNFARDRGLANSFMGRLFERYLEIVDDTMMVSNKKCKLNMKTFQRKIMNLDYIYR